MESVSSVLQFNMPCLMATLSFLRIYTVQFRKKSILPMEISAGGGVAGGLCLKANLEFHKGWGWGGGGGV